MKLVNLYMPDDLRQRLRDETERTGAPMSEIVRRAINTYLDEASTNVVDRRRVAADAKK